MYSQIASNRRRTWVLMVAFVVLLLALGYAFDRVAGMGGGGIILALVVAAATGLLSYFAGDRVALWTSGAQLVTKREAPELIRVVENLAIASGIPTPAVYVIQDPAINAFATGRDTRHASVAVTTGCLERLEREELEGVIAHELSHVRNEDIRVMTIVVVLAGAVALLADWLLRARWYGLGRRDRDDGQLPAVLMALGLLLALVAPLAAQLIKLAISRRREFLADASGALLTRYPDGLARALEKIAHANQPMLRANTATAHLFIANPFGSRRAWFTSLFSTHPPIAERIRILRGMTI